MNKYDEVIKNAIKVGLESVKFAIIAKIRKDSSFCEIWDFDVDEQIYAWANCNGELDKEDYNLINAYYNLHRIAK